LNANAAQFNYFNHLSYFHAEGIFVCWTRLASGISRLEVDQFTDEFAARGGQQVVRSFVLHPRRAVEIGKVVDTTARQLALN
jgi:hypothetical protein